MLMQSIGTDLKGRKGSSLKANMLMMCVLNNGAGGQGCTFELDMHRSIELHTLCSAIKKENRHDSQRKKDKVTTTGGGGKDIAAA